MKNEPGQEKPPPVQLDAQHDKEVDDGPDDGNDEQDDVDDGVDRRLAPPSPDLVIPRAEMFVAAHEGLVVVVVDLANGVVAGEEALLLSTVALDEKSFEVQNKGRKRPNMG